MILVSPLTSQTIRNTPILTLLTILINDIFAHSFVNLVTDAHIDKHLVLFRILTIFTQFQSLNDESRFRVYEIDFISLFSFQSSDFLLIQLIQTKVEMRILDYMKTFKKNVYI